MDSRRFIGAQYYRPPTPPIEDWDRDLSLVRSHGLKLIRTWLYWSRVNPKQDTWDFADYDRLLEIAAKNDLALLVQLIPESAPQWWLSKYPDALLRMQDGTPYVAQAPGMVSVGGYPALSPDVPEVRAAMEEFLRRTVRHYVGREGIYGYDVWNEVVPYHEVNAALYHPATEFKFREWLRQKYGSVEKLNEAWGGWRFTSFDEVNVGPFFSRNYISQLDVHTFHRTWLSDFMRWRARVVREEDPSATILSHAGGHLGQITQVPYDAWEMGEIVDIWGCSDYEEDFHRSAALLNGIRDSCQNKPWWLSEQEGGRVWTLFGNANRSPEFVEQKMIQAFSYGAQANLVWQWRGETFGQEAPNFGLVDEDGEPTPNTAIVGRLAKALEREAELFRNLEFPQPDVGLAIDWRLRSWEYTAFNDAGRFGEGEFLGWHRALTDIGANVRILNLERIAGGVDPRLKFLALPLVVQDAPGLQDALTRFVDGGGHLIAGPHFLTFKSTGFVSPQVPPRGMQELFGSKRGSLNYPKIPSVTIAPSHSGAQPFSIGGYHVLEAYSSLGARSLGATDGTMTATLHSHGSGVACRVGTLLGTAYSSPENGGLALLLRRLLTSAGSVLFPASSAGAIVRMARSGSGHVLFVSNPFDRPIATSVKAPKGAREPWNLVTGERIQFDEDGEMRLNLGSRQSCIVGT